MSQPPPPPSQPPNQPPGQQPPEAGFGAPREPSYGYPQQPPNQPPGEPPQGGGYGYPGQQPGPYGQPPQGGGYGYPQASGQPPQGGGYGYPGQQPGPYGQPQPGPYGQQPTYPMPGPGGQPPSGSMKLPIIIASVVAVALIAVGGVFFLTSGDDTDDESKGDSKGSSEGSDGGDADAKGGESQQDGKGELAWKKDAAPVVDERIAYTFGTWFAGDNVIRYSVDSVVAYNRETGKQAWEIQAPRARHCAASPQASGDKTFIVWGRKCEKVMLIDLVKGESVWDKDLPARDGGDDPDVSYPYATISGDMAGVAWIGGSAAYRVSDGKLLWEAKTGTTCTDRAYIGGEGGEFLSLVECGFGDEYRIQSLTASGATKWEWKAPEGVKVKRILSTDPLVVGVSAGGSSSYLTDIMVLSVSGKTAEVEQKFNLDEEERFDVKCSDIGPTSCYNTIVDKDSNAMYVATKLHTGGDSGGRINEVVAFNLSTGKNKWVSEAANGRETSPLAVQDGKLLTYEKGDFSGDGTVMALDAESGKATDYLELPSEERELSRIASNSGRPYWHEDALFLVREQVFQDQSLNKEGGLAVFR